jgi:hypothetical protein
MTTCYCGGHYRCETCRLDVCYCACRTDGAPQTQAEVTSGHVNPSTARLEAWANKQELTR